jgi:hypothetical protein
LQSPVPKLKSLDPSVDVSGEVENFVFHCLEKDPSNRPANMDEFIQKFQLSIRASGIDFNFSSSGMFDTESSSFRLLRDAVSARQTKDIPVTLAPPVPSAAISTLPPPQDEHVLAATTPTLSSGLAPPQAPSQKKHKKLMAVLGLAGFAIALFVLSWTVLHAGLHNSYNSPAASVSTTAAPKPFVLTIESIPSDSEVYDGLSMIGHTPTQIALSNDQSTNVHARLVLRKSGYLPFELELGVITANKNVTVTLVPAPSASASVAERPADSVTKQGSTGIVRKDSSKTQSKADAGASDIRLIR